MHPVDAQPVMQEVERPPCLRGTKPDHGVDRGIVFQRQGPLAFLPDLSAHHGERETERRAAQERRQEAVVTALGEGPVARDQHAARAMEEAREHDAEPWISLELRDRRVEESRQPPVVVVHQHEVAAAGLVHQRPRVGARPGAGLEGAISQTGIVEAFDDVGERAVLVADEHLDVAPSLPEHGLERARQCRGARTANADRCRERRQRGSTSSLTTRAGTPWTWERAGTSRVTTAPAPTIAPSPTLRWSRTSAAHADERLVADRRRAGDVGAGRDGGEVADRRVVADERAPVQDHVRPEARLGPDDGRRADDAAGAERRTRRDDGTGMDDGREAKANGLSLRDERVPARRPDRTDGLMLGGERRGFVDPGHRETEQRLLASSAVQALDEPLDPVSALRHQIRDLGCKAPRAEHHDSHRPTVHCCRVRERYRMGPRAGRIRHVAASRSGLAVDRLLRLFDAAQWSGLLCRALTGTGLAAAPAEYFNATFRSPLSLRWGTGNDLHAYVRALRANRTSSDGVFGAKLHWDQLEQVRKELRHPVPREAALEILQGWFPGAAYVSIEREDVNRQAVSLWTALRTDVWSVSTSASSPAPPRVPYSYSGIHRQRESIVRGRDAWETAFARTRIETIRVVYEELTGDFQQTVARVLEMATGQRIAAGDVPPAPRVVAWRASAPRSSAALRI